MVDPGVRQVLLGRVVLQFLEINIPARFKLAATRTGRRKNETTFLWRAATSRSILCFEEGPPFNRDTMQTYLRLCSLARVYPYTHPVVSHAGSHRHPTAFCNAAAYNRTLAPDGKILRVVSFPSHRCDGTFTIIEIASPVSFSLTVLSTIKVWKCIKLLPKRLKRKV